MTEKSERKSNKAKRYTEQFKRDAVELLAGGASVEKVALGLGITPVSLREWRRRMAGREDAPPGWTTEDLEAENRRLREQLVSVTAQRDILKKSVRHPLGSTDERYAAMKALETEHGVSEMCRVFAVSRSGYYGWRKAQKK